MIKWIFFQVNHSHCNNAISEKQALTPQGATFATERPLSQSLQQPQFLPMPTIEPMIVCIMSHQCIVATQ